MRTLTFPASRDELATVGLCPVCLNGGESEPDPDETLPVPSLHLVTDFEIEQALEALKG